MKLKKLIGLFMVVTFIVMATLTINISEAYAAADSYVLGLTNVREPQNGKGGAAYGFGGLKSNGMPTKKIWKIVSYPSEGNYTISYANAFYCLKAEYGFMLQADNADVTRVQKTYNLKYDMKSQKDTVLARLQAIDVFKTDPSAYNKVMWLLDNMYLPKKSTQADKIALFINADIIDNANELQYASITDDDIEVIQQMVIWYFTNNNNSNYNAETLPELLFNNWTNNDSGYNTFSDLYDTEDRESGRFRQEECELLYHYFLTEAKKQGNYVSKDAVTPLTFDKTRVQTTPDNNGNYIVGPYRINRNSDLAYTTTTLGFSGASYTLLDANKNPVANNQISLNQDFYVRVPESEAGKTLRFDMNISYQRTSAYYYTKGTPNTLHTDDQPVVLVEKGPQTYTASDSIKIPTPLPFDLSLRKFISEVDGKVPTISREPEVVVTDLKAGRKTTATYNHTKAPLEVNEGSIITYTIRVYNEGKKDGYATEITDHLPPELEFLPNDSVNKSYGWSYDPSDKTNRTIKTSYLSKANGEKNLITAYDGGDTLQYKDLKVRCKLKVTTQEGKRIVNIADITAFTDKDGNTITDRDSQAKNVNLPNDNSLPGYKQTEINRKDPYIPGQQDDDDFDSVYIKVKPFDLSLRKFISSINGEAPKTSREPIVDITGLKAGTSTTAIYNHPKAPLSVEIGDIVTYTIRVYNEGQKDGYVNEITDHLPAQLEFLPEDEENIANGWYYDENDTTLRTIKTAHLSKEVDSDNLIKAFNGNNLDYKEVKVKCKVIAPPTFEKRIVNIADITKFSDKYGNPVTDRDSGGANVQLPPDENLPNYKLDEINRGDKYIPGQQDDDDFDSVRIIYFDLSLRKFITAVNGKVPDVSREPVVDITGLQNKTTTTATYNHPKAPLTVRVGDIVTYTIRVYNEGPKDGYASEITDHLPAHLEFLPEDEENKQKGWVYDETDKTHRTIKTDYLSKEKSEKNLIKAFDGTTLSYKEISVNCKVVTSDPKYSDRIVNIAEITKFTDKDGHEVKDVDSSEDNVKLPEDDKLPNYKQEEIDRGDKYIPGQEDDDDFDSVVIEYFDLALRKFITKVNTLDYNNRYPSLSMGDDGNIKYDHTKEPVLVANGNIVTYTIRIYNEGTMAGYASEVTDDLPEGLVFLPENETNKEYRWKMIDEDGNETDKVEEAKKITTDYLSKDQEKEEGANLLKGFNKKAGLSDTNPDHRDVKIAFKVTEPNTSDRILINTAEISEDTDEEGDPVDDVDSTPGNEDPDEDDIDIEKVRVKYFDLALKKWVSQAIVKEQGKDEVITETGHTGDENPEPVVKVDLKAKDINKVTVKFRYKIKVTNEGEIEGYVKEIKDYIPDGLRFNQADNPKWTQLSEKEVVTDQCKDLLLKPGESTTVEIVLTWENSGDNLGLKVNWAEISKDYNEYEDTPDIDSTPNNKKPGEDDIDQAPVILAIKTGELRIYFTLAGIILVTLAGGIILIKKFVL